MRIKQQNENAECLAALSCANSGDAASEKHIPPDLRNLYTPDRILSNCTRFRGCFHVVRAKQKNSDILVAIKIVSPLSREVNNSVLDQLKREERMLALLSEKKCGYAAQLIGSGQKAVKISKEMSWYILDLLKGESMDVVIYPGTGTGTQIGRQEDNKVAQYECIRAARDILAVLKLVHGEGMLHLNIRPSNIFRCKAVNRRDTSEADSGKFIYKLTGFGNVQPAGDSEAKKAVAITAAKQCVGTEALPYMSPEMYQEPDKATYCADLWSLGITMFELVTCTLPFQEDTSLNWAAAISGNMEGKAPNLLHSIDTDRTSEFDHRLAVVIAKALEKKAIKRYQSADEMHGAVFECLVANGKAFYSAFLSYRAESDLPLAKLLFDELNHSFTPGGHRMAVYLNTFSLSGHVEGADWDEDIASGLLRSICYVPILSYGATAPLAQFAAEDRTQLITMGWEEAPLGLDRLEGSEQDREDALLKEMLIAGALLERSSESVELQQRQKGQLCVAVPVLAGRLQPQGHPGYPGMGNYFDVQGGGGLFSDLPSSSNSQAAVRFLLDRAGLPVEAMKLVEERSVASAVTSLAKLQGCALWNAHDLSEAVLTSEQVSLVGKGNAGPPVDLDENILSTEQVPYPHPTPITK
jgi:serine/threonine protein kinase